MPRHPRVSAHLAGIGGAVYSALAHRIGSYRGERYPFHVGDTWLEPARGCRMQDLRVEDNPGMHRYSDPQGHPALIEAIAARTTSRTAVSTGKDHVLVAAGATGALGAVMGAIVQPGDEVLIVAPYWPLIPGIVRCFHGAPVTVPLIGEVEDGAEARSRLDERLSDRTVALYINTPNNPTGQVLPRTWLEVLVDWAAGHDLWVVADEVYEDYVYTGEHTYCRTLAAERTFSAHSFSKAYGMAGNRCGYVVGPEAVMGELRKVSTHSCYSCATASQLAALRALDGRGDAWVEEVRPRYAEVGRRAAQRLGIAAPQGSTFLFIDVAEHLDDRGLLGFLERCADRGLFLAPGPSFGPYDHHVRLCFTCAEPELVERGVEVLAGMIGR